MFKKAKKQFLLFSMLAMLMVNVTLILALNLVNQSLVNNHLSDVMREIARTRYKDKVESMAPKPDLSPLPVELPDPLPSPVAPQKQAESEKKSFGRHSAYAQYQGRFFSVMLNREEVSSVDMAHHILEDTDVKGLVEKVLDSGREEGYEEDFRFLILPEGEEERICFLDCSTELQSGLTLWRNSVVLFVVGMIVTYFYLRVMAEKIMLPLKEGMERQKRFVTDAGHELKTPLSVLGANMDLLAMDLEDNEWVEISQRQVKKLRKLVEQLISLSKMEERPPAVSMESFSISEAVMDTVDLFSGVAARAGKKFRCEVEEGLLAQGEEAGLREILAILLDNAVKYAIGESPIQVRLYGEGRKVYFETVNEWDQSTSLKDLDRLFDRFYRCDPSRDRSGGREGYGLGLSIAKATAEKSHVQLRALQDEEGRIVFQMVFRRG